MGQQLVGNATSGDLRSAAAQNFLCVQLAQAQGRACRQPVRGLVRARLRLPSVLSAVATLLSHLYAFDPQGLLPETPVGPVKAAEALRERAPFARRQRPAHGARDWA